MSEPGNDGRAFCSEDLTTVRKRRRRTTTPVSKESGRRPSSHVFRPYMPIGNGLTTYSPAAATKTVKSTPSTPLADVTNVSSEAPKVKRSNVVLNNKKDSQGTSSVLHSQRRIPSNSIRERYSENQPVQGSTPVNQKLPSQCQGDQFGSSSRKCLAKLNNDTISTPFGLRNTGCHYSSDPLMSNMINGDMTSPQSANMHPHAHSSREALLDTIKFRSSCSQVSSLSGIIPSGSQPSGSCSSSLNYASPNFRDRVNYVSVPAFPNLGRREEASFLAEEEPDNVDDPIDYNNIENSEIYGFNESDGDLTECESDFGDEDDVSEPCVTNEAQTIFDEDEVPDNVPHYSAQSRGVPVEYASLGAPKAECSKCHARMWKEERVNKQVTRGTPKFSICCRRGRVVLPPPRPIPAYLLALYNDKKKAPHFRKCIRLYNSMFSFTSMGGNVDNSINRGGAPYVFKLNGQNHHRFGSLLPHEGDNPRFCQLYIYDTENEVGNRMRWIDVKDQNQVDPEVVEGLLKMLDETNELVKYFRMARDRFRDEQIVDLRIVIKASRSESGRENHMTPSDEVAAIMVGDVDDTCGRRDIVIDSKLDGLRRISEIHPKLMAMQYPLLFPYGEDDFHEHIYYVKQTDEPELKREFVSQMEFYSYKLMVRVDEALSLRLGGRLYQQYIVDSFASIEQSRLWYVRTNQTKLRSDLYSHIVDYMKEGDGDLSKVGKGFILPSTFVGSRRYMNQNFQDAVVVCRYVGHPYLFLTMTCNPLWDEVLQMMALLPGCQISDSPDIIARVFKLKLDQLANDIKKSSFFGTCIGVMYVIEWQKRGLPHVHMLVWLDSESKKYLNNNVDKFVSAEIPDEKKDPAGYKAVKQFMIHGPCGLERPKSPCMKAKKCIRHFPKRYCARTMFDQSGFPIYRRRKTRHFVKVRRSVLDNQWVVPYNRNLLVKYQCHINVEICNRARCMKYLFKYCLKGSDRATIEVRSKHNSDGTDAPNKPVDEIRNFFDGRYVCGAEAAHRIFAFDIHHRTVSVERLPFHEEGKKNCIYKGCEKPAKVAEKGKNKLSKLEAFFILNSEDPEANKYTYDEIPQHYVWNSGECRWNPRCRGYHIGRLSYTHYSTGELWFLRLLLTQVRGPTCFADVRTVKGIVHETYQEACLSLGLLDSDNEWHECIKEVDKFGLPPQIRQLFVHIITNCKVSDLKHLWECHWRCMADDILHTRRRVTGIHDLHLSDEQLQFYTLAEIDKQLRTIGKSLKNFRRLPQPPERYLSASISNLVDEEQSYDKTELLKQHQELLSKCNSEQLNVYNAVCESVTSGAGGIFFVYGSGGCGKTFLWNTIITRMRSERRIVLPVASSGIAATLMAGGRTAHSRFKIPILVDELSMCSIAHKSDIAELLKNTELIIWDEAPMQHRYTFDCVDRSLRDIMKTVDPSRADLPFGGITVLMGGDFRQILPVVSRGSRSDIVAACLTRSKLWRHVKLFQLTTNMRLKKGCSASENQRLAEFRDWVLKIGNGAVSMTNQTITDSDEQLIEIPEHFIIRSPTKSLHPIIDSIFPDLTSKYSDPEYLSARALLTPTNQTVAHLNNIILQKIPGDIQTYYSADKAEYIGGHNSEIDTDYPVEYLNSFTIPGIPPHDLNLKVGVVVMLMRNLNQTLGLCNGSRMIVKRCLEHSVECEVISGNFIGSMHFIPRMELSPTESIFPFHFIRKQFPLQVCYAMTINKAQGQSLENVGLYLPEKVFTHGQLYVALSRVTSPEGLKVCIKNKEGKNSNITANIVYNEVFYCLPK